MDFFRFFGFFGFFLISSDFSDFIGFLDIFQIFRIFLDFFGIFQIFSDFSGFVWVKNPSFEWMATSRSFDMASLFWNERPLHGSWGGLRESVKMYLVLCRRIQILWWRGPRHWRRKQCRRCREQSCSTGRSDGRIDHPAGSILFPMKKKIITSVHLMMSVLCVSICIFHWLADQS